jgi:hypothetical protein
MGRGTETCEEKKARRAPCSFRLRSMQQREAWPIMGGLGRTHIPGASEERR